MNNGMLLAFSVCANVCGAIVRKFITNRCQSNGCTRLFYNLITSAVSAVMLLVLAENLQASLFTVLLALAFGIITALQFAPHRHPVSHRWKLKYICF